MKQNWLDSSMTDGRCSFKRLLEYGTTYMEVKLFMLWNLGYVWSNWTCRPLLPIARKTMQTLSTITSHPWLISMGDHQIISKLFIIRRYLVNNIDARLYFKGFLYYRREKPAKSSLSLARTLPNLGRGKSINGDYFMRRWWNPPYIYIEFLSRREQLMIQCARRG